MMAARPFSLVAAPHQHCGLIDAVRTGPVIQRLYGPLEPYFDKMWLPRGDIEDRER